MAGVVCVCSIRLFLHKILCPFIAIVTQSDPYILYIALNLGFTITM